MKKKLINRFFYVVTFLLTLFFSVAGLKQNAFAVPGYSYGKNSSGYNELLPCADVVHARNACRTTRVNNDCDANLSYLSVPYSSSSTIIDRVNGYGENGTLVNEWLIKDFGSGGPYVDKVNKKITDGSDMSWRDEMFGVNFKSRKSNNTGKCDSIMSDVSQVQLWTSESSNYEYEYGFRCITRGYHGDKSLKIGDKKTEVVYWKHADGYDYFEATLYPSDTLSGNWQTIFGLVKVKAYVLMAEAIDISDHKAISGVSKVTTNSVRQASSASLSVSKPSGSGLTGYTFVGWSTNKNATTGTAGDTYSVDVCSGGCSDRTVYALYKKSAQYKITAKAVNIVDHKLISGVTDTQSSAVASGGSASVGRPNAGNTWVFLGWNTNQNAAKSDLTGASNANYSATLTGNLTVYAFFVKKYSLTVNAGTGTSITVNRTASAYGGGATGNLSNGATIYDGDKLNVTFGLNSGYSWGSHSLVGKDTNNTTSTSITGHTVGANVTATSSASLNQYTLTAVPMNIYDHQQLSGVSSTTATASHGSNATVTKPTASGYKFLGWSESNSAVKTSLTNTSSNTYTANLTANKTVYAYYSREYKLTIDAGTGTSISVSRINSDYGGGGTGALSNNATIYEGDRLSVTMSLNSGYSWVSHELIHGGGDPITSLTISNHIVGSNVTVKTRATEQTFKGKVSVGTANTGWVNSDTTGTPYKISNCAASGCEVTFTHELQRATGSGNVKYEISRTSNYDNVSSDTIVSERTYSFGSSDPVKTDTMTLYPGQIVCETLKFNPKATNESQKVSVTICAQALGVAQPSDKTLLKIRVKNENLDDTYKDTVYAKPGNKLTYETVYNPALQYAANLKPQRISIIDSNGSTKGPYPATGTNSSSKMTKIYNDNRSKVSGLEDWKNAFSVSSSTISNIVVNDSACNNADNKQNCVYTNGDNSKKTVINSYTVAMTDAGKDLNEKAETNLNNTTKTTPKQITFTSGTDNILVSSIDTRKVESEVHAYVPYNFNTSVEITTESGTLDAGEEGNAIKYEIAILPKANNTTSPGTPYATIVRDAISKVIIYTTNNSVGEKTGGVYGTGTTANLCSYYPGNTSCRYEDEKVYNGTSNSYLNTGEGSGLNGKIYENLQTTVSALDVNAGEKFCVAVAIYPSDSGSEINLVSTGSNQWRISDSKCYSIGKRPTFQVWGGSFYAASSVNTSTTAKKNLGSTKIDDGVIVFGSWVEHSVVANGEVKGLASGAASGLASNLAGGGSLEKPKDSYCKYRVPLNFANYTTSSLLPLCSGGSSSAATGFSGITASTDKESLTSPLPNETSDSYDYNNGAAVNFVNNSDKDTVRYNGSGSLVINATTIPAGKTHIVKAVGDITITGNIIYADTTYTNLAQIPKMIIYAEGNINIYCSVDRIDAMIISEKEVKTCSDSNDLNNEKNSRQLVVNGAIITGKLTLNRTFGAATGEYSKIPAEIVNYDTSILLWGRSKANAGDNDYGTVYKVYQRDLAPRY